MQQLESCCPLPPLGHRSSTPSLDQSASSRPAPLPLLVFPQSLLSPGSRGSEARRNLARGPRRRFSPRRPPPRPSLSQGPPVAPCACPTSSCPDPGLLIRPPSQTVPCQVPGGFLKRKSHHVASNTLTIYIPPKDKPQISWQGPEVSGVWVLPFSPATFHNAPLTHSCGGFAASPFGSLCSALALPCPALP